MTLQQTDFIYKKVELRSLINKSTMKEELDADIELDRMDEEIIINNTYKVENVLPQMEQWSILSNGINYVQYNKNPKSFHSITIRPVKCNKVVKDAKVGM